MINILRDPAWQGVAALLAIVSLLLGIYLERKKLFPQKRQTTDQKPDLQETPDSENLSPLAMFFFGMFSASLALAIAGLAIKIFNIGSSLNAENQNTYCLYATSSTIIDESRQSGIIYEKTSMNYYDREIIVSIDSISSGQVLGSIGSPGCENKDITWERIGFSVAYECNNNKFDIRITSINEYGNSTDNVELFITKIE